MSDNNTKKIFRGRFQAQGEGLEKSVSWARIQPLTKNQGKCSLGSLKDKLTKREYKQRRQCFSKAQSFIEKAPKDGYNIIYKFPFTPFPPVKDIRVDIDIFEGKTFIDD